MINSMEKLVLLGLLASVISAEDDLLAGKERCLRHEDTPNPQECCTRPLWVNRIFTGPCRFEHAEVEGYSNSEGSCVARCGFYKINMTMTDRIVRVRLFRQRMLTTRDTDLEWAQAIVDGLSHCKPRITALQGKRIREQDAMEECEIADDILGDCLRAQLFLHCPRYAWIGSPSCNAMQDLLVSGCPYKSLGEIIVLQDQGHPRDREYYDNDDDRYQRREYDEQRYGTTRRINDPDYEMDTRDRYRRDVYRTYPQDDRIQQRRAMEVEVYERTTKERIDRRIPGDSQRL